MQATTLYSVKIFNAAFLSTRFWSHPFSVILEILSCWPNQSKIKLSDWKWPATNTNRLQFTVFFNHNPRPPAANQAAISRQISKPAAQNNALVYGHHVAMWFSMIRLHSKTNILAALLLINWSLITSSVLYLVKLTVYSILCDCASLFWTAPVPVTSGWSATFACTDTSLV